MGSLFVLIFSAVILIVLLNSTIRFFAKGNVDGNVALLSAVASSLVTLFAVVLMYEGVVRANIMEFTRQESTSRLVRARVRADTGNFDHFFTRATNVMNPGRDVGYRPHVVLWPLVLLGLAYVVRWVIYLYLERKDRDHSAVTGSAYWSHFCAYAMAVAFLIVVARWNPALVLIISVGLLLLLFFGLAEVLQDLAVLAKSMLVSLGNVLRAVGKTIARFGVAIAGGVRTLFAHAHELYRKHVRQPVRAMSGRMVKASATLDLNAEEKLEQQNTAHRDRFGDTVHVGGSDDSSTSDEAAD